MKNYLLVLVVIFIGMFSSCQKDTLEEISPTISPVVDDVVVSIPLDTLAMQKELAGYKNITQKQAQDSIFGMLKAATVNTVKFRPLNHQVYIINDSLAIKLYYYSEIKPNTHLAKELTVFEEHKVESGRINLAASRVYAKPYCNFGRFFYLEDSAYLNEIVCFFRYPDGTEISYTLDNTNANVFLPNISGGQWQIKFRFNRDGFPQTFLTDFIDFYGESNLLKLKFEIKEETVISRIRMDKELIKGVETIQFYGENDEVMTVNVAYDKGLPQNIVFEAPFKIRCVVINTEDEGNRWYYTNEMLVVIDELTGKRYFILQ